VPLADLEDGLLARCDVAAVAVDEHDPSKAVRDQVLGQVVEQVEVDARTGRERSLEVHVVMRVSQPHERPDQHLVRHRRAHAPHDLADQQAVGEERHVLPMLLERRRRHHNGDVARQVADLRPRHLLQQHHVPPVCALTYRLTTFSVTRGSLGSDYHAHCRPAV